MHHKKTRSAGFIALVSSLAMTASSFASVTYSDAASFNLALNSTVVDDYENAGYVFIQGNAAMSNVLGEASYTSTAFPDWNIVGASFGNQYYCAGCNGSFLLDFTSTSVSGANGVFGVGFNFFNSGNPSYVATVTYGDNSTGDIAIPFAVQPSSNQFWGVTSSLEISRIHFGLANGGTTTGGSFGIDNLTIGNAGSQIPEPAAGLLFGLGLLGLCAVRKRQAA